MRGLLRSKAPPSHELLKLLPDGGGGRLNRGEAVVGGLAGGRPDEQGAAVPGRADELAGLLRALAIGDPQDGVGVVLRSADFRAIADGLQERDDVALESRILQTNQGAGAALG